MIITIPLKLKLINFDLYIEIRVLIFMLQKRKREINRDLLADNLFELKFLSPFKPKFKFKNQFNIDLCVTPKNIDK